MAIKTDVQQPDLGEFVVLYMLDASGLGGSYYYFTQSAHESAVVQWKRHPNDNRPGPADYSPIDIEAEGFEFSGQGQLPRPKFRISNVTLALMSAVIAWNDLLGAVVTRYRTLKKYLYGQPGYDPDAHFPEDVYVIERKTLQSKVMIEWELSSILDFQGQQLPRRKALRDYCTHRYRVWDPNAEKFIYTHARCPYRGNRYYDALDVEQAGHPELDRCGKRLSSCRLRFTGKQPLPTTALPGLARSRM